MNLSQAYLQYPFTRASRTRAGFGHPNTVANFRAFWLWSKKNNPEFFEAVKRQAPHLITVQGRALESGPPGLGELVDDPIRIYAQELGVAEPQKAASTSWADKLMSIAGGLVGVYQQKKVMDLQIKRAEQGLAPIEVSQLTPPTVAVRHELPPELTAGLATGKKLAMPLLIGGALLLFMMMQGRRR